MKHNSSFVKSNEYSYDIGLRSYMVSIYKYMCIALLITGVVSVVAASSESFMRMILAGQGSFIITLAPVAMALYIGVRITSMSEKAARLCLWIYSALMGVSLSVIYYVYTSESIASVFFISASVFGGAAVYGHTTKRDLSQMSSFFVMGLIGLFVASIVNIVMRSSALSFGISLFAVPVFVFLAAYDNQKLKSVYYQVANKGGMVENIAVFGALQLYLDFINIFINLLRLLGDRK